MVVVVKTSNSGIHWQRSSRVKKVKEEADVGGRSKKYDVRRYLRRMLEEWCSKKNEESEVLPESEKPFLKGHLVVCVYSENRLTCSMFELCRMIFKWRTERNWKTKSNSRLKGKRESQIVDQTLQGVSQHSIHICILKITPLKKANKKNKGIYSPTHPSQHPQQKKKKKAPQETKKQKKKSITQRRKTADFSRV
jgi:hypothetical protein